MMDYKEVQLAPSILEGCKGLRELLLSIEDTNLDAICQTELGTADYQGQPNPALIRDMANRLGKIATLSENLIQLTTYTERRAIEAQGLLPWRFDK
jgi:hypothetical protein